MFARSCALSAAPLLLGGCFLFVDFPDKPADGGAGAGAGGAAAAGGGGAGTAGAGTGGAPPAACPPTDALAGTFVGGDVRITSVATRGSVAFVAGVFDGNEVLRYRAQPGDQCSVTIEVAGGTPTFLAAIDLPTFELTWWAVLADNAGLVNDAEVVVAAPDALVVATTHDATGETFGAASVMHGYAWAHVATEPLTVDPATRLAQLAISDVRSCDTDAVSNVALAARGDGAVMAVSSGKATCAPECGAITANASEDAVVFELGSDLSCLSPAEPFFHDNKPDLDCDVAAVGGTNILLGFRGDDEKGYYRALGPSPATTVVSDDFGGLAGLVPLGRVHVAAGPSSGLVAATTKTAMSARTISWRSFDTSTQAFLPAAPIGTSTLAPELDVALGDAAALAQGGFVMVGGLDEGGRAADGFGGAWSLDEPKTGCADSDPATTCGDAFLVRLDESATPIAGERWAADGHQSLTQVAVADGPAGLLLSGVFSGGLAIGPTTLDVGAQSGAFLALRPLP